MNVDLQVLHQKYPGHVFVLDGNRVICDNKQVATMNLEVPEDRVVAGMTEKHLLETQIEMNVRLLEDPHYYDYDVALKRKQCRESSSS